MPKELTSKQEAFVRKGKNNDVEILSMNDEIRHKTRLPFIPDFEYPRTWTTQQVCQFFLIMCGGSSIEAACTNTKISRKTLYRFFEREPLFRHTIDTIQRISDSVITGMSVQDAVNGTPQDRLNYLSMRNNAKRTQIMAESKNITLVQNNIDNSTTHNIVNVTDGQASRMSDRAHEAMISLIKRKKEKA